MDALQSFLANFARVENEVAYRAALRVRRICLDPSSMGWEACTDSAIEKRLDSRSWRGELIGRENLTVGIPDEDEMGMVLFEKPSGGESGDCSIQTEFVSRL
jgi:hypothetical protein